MKSTKLLLALAVVVALAPVFAAPAAAAPHPAPAGTPAPSGISGAAGYTSMPPERVLDTRFGTGAPVGPVRQGGTLVLDLSARVPATATAVVLNVTGTEPTAYTYVTVYPDGSPRPISSNLNLAPGETRPNLVTVAVPASRRLALFNHAGNTHLVADLAGYYATDATARFTAQAPRRIYDTRTFGRQPLGPGSERVIDLSWSIPESATAVTFNLTGTEATAAGTYVTAWPTGSPRPNASNLNVGAGRTTPNLVTVAVGTDRQVSLFNHAGYVHLIVDLAAFYTPDYGAVFTAAVPTRVLDTRVGTGGRNTPLRQGESWDLRLGTRLPARTLGVVLNLTGTNPTSYTYVAARPAGAYLGLESNLNLVPGQTAPNLASIGVGPLNTISLFNHSGSVDLIADLAGWFEVPDAPCGAGCVYAWGWNMGGQLGTGSPNTASNEPSPVWGLNRITAVAGGGAGYALRTNGTVVAWGTNGSMNLGNGWTGDKSAVPVPVIGVDQVTAIAAGGSWGMALRSDGTVWSWGSSPNGSSYTADMVPGLTGVVQIEAGSATAYALRSDGTVWAWGSDQHGQLGNGAGLSDSRVPVQVAGLTGVTDITGGAYNGYAVRDDGTVWAWGSNHSGLLGNGSTCETCLSNVPVQVSGLAGAVQVEASSRNTFVLLADGTVRAWGSRTRGSLGDGTSCSGCSTAVPVQVSGLAGVVDVAANGEGGYALTEGGVLWGWGANVYGQLAGAGVGEYAPAPVQLPGPAGVTAVEGGSYAGFALVS